MIVYAAARVPHPIQDYHLAAENRRLVCEARGYCGPFINQDYYRAFPDPMWHDTGECEVCCSTCNVPREEAKRREIEEISTPIRAPRVARPQRVASVA